MLSLNDYIRESILNNDEQVQSNASQAAEHAFDPIPKHTTGKDYTVYTYYFKNGDLKTWLKHATLDQWIILFDDAIKFLRRA